MKSGQMTIKEINDNFILEWFNSNEGNHYLYGVLYHLPELKKLFKNFNIKAINILLDEDDNTEINIKKEI